jgi:hypothetical protein
MADFQKTIYEQFYKSNIAQELIVHPRDTRFFRSQWKPRFCPNGYSL